MSGENGQTDPDRQPDDTPAPSPPKRIRVAWIAPDGIPPRYERMLQPLAVGLIDEMVQLVLICDERTGPGSLPSTPMDVLQFRGSRWPRTQRQTAGKLADELRSRKVNLLHAVDAAACGVTRRIAHRAGLDYVVSVHRLGASRHLHAGDARMAGVLAGGQRIRRDLLTHHAAPAGRIAVVPPGVHQVRNPTCFTDGQTAAAVVACGRLDDLHCWETLVRSYAAVRDAGHDCEFFIIGDGPAESRLRKLAESLELGRQVTFAGWQRPRQLAGILKGADVYVSPRSSQAVDMATLLAMAAGVPVISAGADASDFVIESRTALMCDGRDAADLTARIVSLLDDHAAATELAAAALAHLREHHTPAKMVRAVVDVYRGALERGE